MTLEARAKQIEMRRKRLGIKKLKRKVNSTPFRKGGGLLYICVVSAGGIVRDGHI